MSSVELLGYADRLSVAPGEDLRFMVSTTVSHYTAEMVRLTARDGCASGRTEACVGDVPKEVVAGRHQLTAIGSYIIVDSAEPLRAVTGFTLTGWIFPTAPHRSGGQGVMGAWSENERAGYLMLLDEAGRPGLRIGSGDDVDTVISRTPVEPRQWYFLAATFDAQSRTAFVCLRTQGAAHGSMTRRTLKCGLARPAESPFLIAASQVTINGVAGSFNGKIDSPSVYGQSLDRNRLGAMAAETFLSTTPDPPLLAAWNLAPRDSQLVLDGGPYAMHGRVINLPMRGVTGRRWSGETFDWRSRPEEYSAIHFHNDDLEDAGWDADFGWRVPASLQSGVYAARLTTPSYVEHIPFVVRPREKAARTLVLLPTLTYLAYANFRGPSASAGPERPSEWVGPLDPLDKYLADHLELGASLYDHHSDGSGHCYSSRLRPIVNFRPWYRTWYVNGPRHFATDLQLINWLEAKGCPFDVLTDEDLHRGGVSTIRGYDTVITGSHPEYATKGMINALEQFVASGGNLMYLGGNGFYWVTSLGGDDCHYVEVRRGVSGTRAWESAPGETHHSTTGEPGGLWRHRGRPPNRLVGVGTASWGGGSGRPYVRTPDSFREEFSWIFEGVAAGEPIGAFGLCLGAAAGDEIDRLDERLSTPLRATVVASARSFNDDYQLVVEDVLQLDGATGGSENDNVRADMVVMDVPGGGRVFSVGSVAWCGSLSHRGYNNPVSRITENVLREFSS